MSEYQYYEFLAIDQPLNQQQIEQVRRYSTRATITATRFVNEYHWGDFRGDPTDFLTRFFDAMVYVANWGTRQFRFRIPSQAVDLADIEPYETESSVSFDRVGKHVLVDLSVEEEPEYGWEEDADGWMASLSPLRTGLMAGDLRGLYLAWLGAVTRGEVDEAALEPPVPPGLNDLSTAQQSLVEFLGVDGDLIHAARQASPPLAEPTGLDDWIAALPAAEKDRLLLAVCRGEATLVQGELAQRFRKESTSDREHIPPRRSVAELTRLARDQSERRRLALAEQRAKERARREAEATAAREARLKTLAQRQPQAWREVEQWIDEGKAASYDRAVSRLADLAELAKRESTQTQFTQRFTDLQQRHTRKHSLMDKLAHAGLIPR